MLPSLRGPLLLSDHQGPMLTSSLADVRGLASTRAPKARAVTCFSEEAKWSPVVTYVALGWQDVNSAPKWRLTLLFQSAYTWQDQRLRLVAICASLYTLNPSNSYAPYCSLLHLAFLEHFLLSNALSSCNTP